MLVSVLIPENNKISLGHNSVFTFDGAQFKSNYASRLYRTDLKIKNLIYEIFHSQSYEKYKILEVDLTSIPTDVDVDVLILYLAHQIREYKNVIALTFTGKISSYRNSISLLIISELILALNASPGLVMFKINEFFIDYGHSYKSFDLSKYIYSSDNDQYSKLLHKEFEKLVIDKNLSYEIYKRFILGVKKFREYSYPYSNVKLPNELAANDLEDFSQFLSKVNLSQINLRLFFKLICVADLYRNKLSEIMNFDQAKLVIFNKLKGLYVEMIPKLHGICKGSNMFANSTTFLPPEVALMIQALIQPGDIKISRVSIPSNNQLLESISQSSSKNDTYTTNVLSRVHADTTNGNIQHPVTNNVLNQVITTPPTVRINNNSHQYLKITFAALAITSTCLLIYKRNAIVCMLKSCIDMRDTSQVSLISR